MGKTLFGISCAASIVAFVVGFAVADNQARHAPQASVDLSPFKMMMGANQMPSEHFADYSFVFN
jgi:hypothetical protein